MARLEELRGKIDTLQHRLQLVALRTTVESDRDTLVKLQEESLELQAELHATETTLGMELKASSTRQMGGDTPKPASGPRSQRMGTRTTKLEARVTHRMPNVPTSLVHLLARATKPLVTVDVTNVDKETRRVRVTVHLEGFSARAIATKEIDSGKTGSFDLFPAFFPDRIATVTELTTAALHVLVEDLDGKTELHESYPLPLLARTTAPLWTLDPVTGQHTDLTPYLAAWVTPNAPELLEVLRRAADFSKFKAMLGYQTDAAGVREHVRAIFEMLKAEGLVYVNSPISFGNAQGQFIQRIRLPRESLKSRSANCIDGTVLMASLLEATALQPAIVLVPGHAYLAWRTQPAQPDVPDSWEFVETTLIATASFDDACQAARDRTTQQLLAAQKNPGKTYVRLLPIPVARSLGITPME